MTDKDPRFVKLGNELHVILQHLDGMAMVAPLRCEDEPQAKAIMVRMTETTKAAPADLAAFNDRCKKRHDDGIAYDLYVMGVNSRTH